MIMFMSVFALLVYIFLSNDIGLVAEEPCYF